MPLDPVAQRYAQTLFAQESDELAQRHAARMAQARASLAQRGLSADNAGIYHAELTRLRIEHITEIANAKVDALLAAYGHAQLPIDDQAVVQIDREVERICDAQETHLKANVTTEVERAQLPSAVAQQLASAIERGASAIKAQTHRRLSARRDEEMMAARVAHQPQVPEYNPPLSTGKRFTQLWHRSAKWPWYTGVFLGAIAMISIQEYLFSVLLLPLSAISLLSTLLHSNHRTVFKFFGAAAITFALVAFIIIVLSIKGASSWSHLEKPILRLVEH